MKEVREKLQLIGDEGGLDMSTGELLMPLEGEAILSLISDLSLANPTLEALDLEGDFDAEAHDRQMAMLYANDNYYAEAVRSRSLVLTLHRQWLILGNYVGRGEARMGR